MKRIFILLLGASVSLTACKKDKDDSDTADKTAEVEEHTYNRYTDTYVPFKLTTDLSKLEEYEVQMLPHLIAAADIMNDVFWVQTYGDKDELLASIDSPDIKRFAEINYGPWDRLDDYAPFVEGVGPKPKGANFYPHDITKADIAASDIDSTDQYSMVRRDSNGNLISIPYHVFFNDKLQEAASHLRKAAEICEDEGLKHYLELRAEALLTDNFNPSDIAWLGLEDNGLDIIIGPIENYEDALYGSRTSYESYVLVKDKDWSEKLKKYVSYLPELQENLPVDEAYKKEKPGSSSQLNAYDVVYYAGDCNAGSKTIAVNLPNDATLQVQYGTRRSQLKNAMKAKFDKILLPISDELIDSAQRKHITFDAFFANTMFHEVAHGLGIKNTINGKGEVQAALSAHYSALEEGKADILGLYMVTYLRENGVITEGELMDNYVTFLASIFRSVRFGAASAHGKANMIRFNYFKDMGAFTKNEETGTYSVNMEKMKEAMTSLTALILKLQGDGDVDGVKKLLDEKGSIGPELQADLDRLTTLGIPVDVIFEQGVDVLGLSSNG